MQTKSNKIAIIYCDEEGNHRTQLIKFLKSFHAIIQQTL